MRRLAIVANGAPMQTVDEWEAFAQCDVVAYCDRLPLKGDTVPPTAFIIGDGDTLSPEQKKAIPFIQDDDQETNDLTKAFRYAMTHVKPECIYWFCVTGLRDDHTLANLSLIYDYGLPGSIFTNDGRFTLLQPGSHTLAVKPHTPISFISLRPQRITAEGVVWRVENLYLETLWRATLNRTAAPTLILSNEAPLYIYQPRSSL